MPLFIYLDEIEKTNEHEKKNTKSKEWEIGKRDTQGEMRQKIIEKYEWRMQRVQD